MADLGRTLVGLGVVLLVVGGLFIAGSRLGISLPLGRLPGDLAIKREGFTFYFPLTSSIVVSLILSAILYWLRR